jgi:hypothetical protein
MSADFWQDRAQTAEAVNITLKEASAAALGRIKEFKANFGIREKQGGIIEIDFDKFVTNIGAASALELKKVIEDTYKV